MASTSIPELTSLGGERLWTVDVDGLEIAFS